MRRRLVVITEIIAPYRIPVFNALAKNKAVNLHVVFLAETNSGLRQWRVYKNEIAFSHEVLPSWRFLTGKYDLLLNWGLRSCLNKFAPQTIICGGYNYIASWEALWWKQRHQAELVLWSESNSQDARGGRAWVESLKKYFIARCERFVVPGATSSKYLESLGSAQKDILVAPNAVDNVWFKTRADEIRSRAAEFRESLGLPPRFLLFSGRLVPQKGVFVLLEAYAKLEIDTRSQIGLVFAGDGLCKTELEQEAKRMSPGVVCFPGFVQREDLAGLYALAEALILPTHSDPWGLVVNEAMACGLPIIVSSVAGCSADLVKDGWNGYIVPPGDSEKLSVAINSLVRQPELGKKMSARSAEWIQNYSPEACANGLARAAIGAGKGSQ
jgi:glycosyltransferase involved in cell wall biosynthesis